MTVLQGQDADRIRGLLSDIEHRYNVEVLLAVESGSRAWGFESPDSDFDVRFVYREAPKEAFRLYPGRDVIDHQTTRLPDGSGVPIDMVGWSLAKALRLGVSSNPQLAEWRAIHTMYRYDRDFLGQLEGLMSLTSPRSLAHHYRGLATKTQKEYLTKPEDPVGKKYLYAIRPILATQWMLDHPHRGVTPPVKFTDLRKQVQVDTAIDHEIDSLLEWKMSRDETSGRKRFPRLDAWIDAQLEFLKIAVADLPDPHVDPEIAEEIYRSQYPDVIRPGTEYPEP